ITEATRIGALAAAWGLGFAPHLWTGALGFAAGLHVLSASTAGWIVEYSLGHNPLLHDLVKEDFPVVDGHVDIPDRPGLGVTIDADFVKETAQPK
ncbi:MAG: enolase C-terminal domain-like protein, partial [Alphaproteobacteria bacterium]